MKNGNRISAGSKTSRRGSDVISVNSKDNLSLDNNTKPLVSTLSSSSFFASGNKEKLVIRDQSLEVVNSNTNNRAHNETPNTKRFSVVHMKDETFESKLEEDEFIFNNTVSKNKDDMHLLMLKPPKVDTNDHFRTPESSKGSSRRTSVLHPAVLTPPLPFFAYNSGAKAMNGSGFSSPLAPDEQEGDYFVRKRHQRSISQNSLSGYRSTGPVQPQFLETEPSNIYVNSQGHMINASMGPMIPLTVAIPSPFDPNYGSYLIPANLLTPYSASHSHSNLEMSPFFPTSSWNGYGVDDTGANLSRCQSARLGDDAAQCKVTYKYDFSTHLNNIGLSMLNAIVFTNLNNNLKLDVFAKALNLLFSENIKNLVQFKIDKNGEREINTILIEFLNNQRLEQFTNEFIRDLQKWKNQFKSDNLLFKKCFLQTNITNQNGIESPLMTHLHVDMGRFLIVDSLDFQALINILKLDSIAESYTEDETKRTYLKILSIHTIETPDAIKSNDANSENCQLLVFHTQFYKKIALDLLKSHSCPFDVYDVRNLKLIGDTQDKSSLNATSDDLKLNELDADLSSIWVSKLKNACSFLTSPYTEYPLLNESNLEKLKPLKINGQVYKVVEAFKKEPALDEHVNPEEDSEAHANKDILTQHNQPISGGETIDVDSSADNSSFSSDTLNGDILFDSRRKSSLTTSISSYSTSSNSATGGLKKYTGSRLIFISNLPPVVKTFDIVNVIRGGILEQIQYLPGQRFCFIKFISKNAAVKFFENSQRNPIFLHGYLLSIQFGKKGNSLPHVLPSVLKKVSLGATRNVYLSLPEFAYKKKYISDPKYMNYRQFKLPVPQQIIDDFSATFGSLEQINFAKDVHCCWINFMSIHSAIKLIEWVENSPDEFHQAFGNRYKGLVLRYGKDRCEKDFKNFNTLYEMP